MPDLRTAVFRHLQRLSLAFFTRTRTGEVQSRIASDIGGVENGASAIAEYAQPGDLILTLGAGNVQRAGETFLENVRHEKE